MSPQNTEPLKGTEKPAELPNVKDTSSPPTLPKFFDEDNFITAQKRVQFLLSKLHNLLQIKVDLDQLLALTREFGDAANSLSKDGHKAYQQVTRGIDFKVVVERLMKKEKILEIDQDVQMLLSRLRQLVQLQSSAFQTITSSSPLMKIYCEGNSFNPLHSKTAFLHFIMGRGDITDVKFTCKNSLREVAHSGQPSSPITAQPLPKDEL